MSKEYKFILQDISYIFPFLITMTNVKKEAEAVIIVSKYRKIVKNVVKVNHRSFWGHECLVSLDCVHRYAEVEVSKVRFHEYEAGKLYKAFVGCDANVLYLYC